MTHSAASLSPSALEWIALGCFIFAIAHTFSVGLFERLAHRSRRHAGLWHFFGEVEVVFGLWATVFVLAFFVLEGTTAGISYLDSRNFTEPMFVFAIMVVAGSRPILQLTQQLVAHLAHGLPMSRSRADYVLALAVLPLLGSLVTEPAAMTIAALMLSRSVFARTDSLQLKYATLGTLFVNISIGGTLTPYAAPPILMVVVPWNWDLAFMLTHFGWKAAIAVVINAAIVTGLFWKPLGQLEPIPDEPSRPINPMVSTMHLLFLAGIIYFAHHPVIFMSLLVFFIGYTKAYPGSQSRLMLPEALLVGFFLGGLVVLGGLQRWWLQPLLAGMDATSVFFGATALTAVTDNAALTYLASLVEGLSPEFKYALVAGAVTGGGLTLIANAPNPAGASILRHHFPDHAISPARLFISALLPTLVAGGAFLWL